MFGDNGKLVEGEVKQAVDESGDAISISVESTSDSQS